MDHPPYLSPDFSAAFADPDIVRAYRHRPPYAPALFTRLRDLITTRPHTVLDVGCGRGELARPLAPFVDRVDAVDASAPMIEAGRREPGGDAPNLRWIVGRAEEVPLDPPYALIMGGASLHWLDWQIILPRFAAALTPEGVLALTGAEPAPPPWEDGLVRIIDPYTTNPPYRPYAMVAAWEAAGLFTERGRQVLEPVRFVQPTEDYIEALHSVSYLSRARMGTAVAACDAAVGALVAPYAVGGMLELQVVVRVLWGEVHRVASQE